MLDYPNFQYLKYLFPNLFKKKINLIFQFDICPNAKHHRDHISLLILLFLFITIHEVLVELQQFLEKHGF